jgi:hypothetical protein
MSLVQDSTWQSVQPLPNYPEGTDLYFKVFAVGGQQDTTETYKFMYTVRPFEYCETSGSMTYNGNVTLVNFEEINKTSGKTAPYINYTLTDSATIYRTQNYDLTVNLNTDNGNYTYYAKAWIDWNKDADFDDANESYELGSVTNNQNGQTTLSPFSIQVPDSAALGATTMRVACKYNEYPTLCENNFDGEVEDYKLNVISELLELFPLNDGLSEMGVIIFPNPSKDFVNILFKAMVVEFKIELIDQRGRIVLHQEERNTNKTSINLRNLTSGVYLLKIEVNSKIHHFKFIKE